MSSYSLIILKNPDLLQSLRDYFYQSLLQYGFDKTIISEEHKIDSVLKEITTSYAVIIQEGMFFLDNLEPPEQDELISKTVPKKILLDAPLNLKPGMSEVEQVNSIMSYKLLSPTSYYFPLQTSTKSKVFVTKFSNYISVANGVDSLKRIKDVYKTIKTITYYDTSIVSLIFTELLIKNYKGNYNDFVQEFDNVYGAIEFNRSFDRKAYHELDSYTDPEEIKPILEYIRNNVEVKFCIGDITRTSILEQLEEDTIISLTNAFQFKYNLIRESEQHFWFDKIKELDVKIDVLH